MKSEESFRNYLTMTCCRVHTYWTEGKVVSLLSIKSAIIEDTGNYSCTLPTSGDKVTASLLILKGSHLVKYFSWCLK